jgi:hypothetical protein
MVSLIRADVVTPRRRSGFEYKANGTGNYKPHPLDMKDNKD